MDIGDKCSSIVDIFANEIEKKKLCFTDTLEVTHRHVFADQVKLVQILVNLVGNAVKYTPEGGYIHLRTVEIPCEREGFASYVITVEDDGIGMTEEFCRHVFESFTREHTSTESRVIGTGLGMAIVKRLVDLMDGSIEVESELGKGSVFTTTLTLQIADISSADGDQAQPEYNLPCYAGKRILLAEDNDLNAEIIAEILGEMKIETERAADGMICIDMITKANAGYYDAVLMDIQMPNLNGYEATRMIRLMNDTKKAQIPIIAMTANAFEEDRQNAVKTGMNGHLAKPIELTKLIDILAEILKVQL